LRSAGTDHGDAKAAGGARRGPMRASGDGRAPGDGKGGRTAASARVAMERPPPFAEELWACIHCNYCSAECPTAREVGWESTTPRGKIRLLKYLAAAWSPKRGVEVPQAFIRGVYECTSCGRCSVVCHVGIDYLAHNEGMRRWLARSGCGPMEDHDLMALEFKAQVFLTQGRIPGYAEWFAEGLRDMPMQRD